LYKITFENYKERDKSMTKASKNCIIPTASPVLDKVIINFDDTVDFNSYPFTLDIIKNLKDITFPTQVTFFIGENGAGKSTILEAIAYKFGFGLEGGSKNINFKTAEEQTYRGIELLAEKLTLSWRQKPTNGYFFRAESFYNVANYVDYIAHECGGNYSSYGGKSLHEQSHGESFLSFFKNRLGTTGFFIFDEPEAALSPQRQLSLISIIHDVCKDPNAQFIIATHSPLLLAYPGATIYSCDTGILTPIKYQDTQHYKITKQFLDNPDNYLRYLLED
jgi:predicted ATPase